jgi:hypothetical protein
MPPPAGIASPDSPVMVPEQAVAETAARNVTRTRILYCCIAVTPDDACIARTNPDGMSFYGPSRMLCKSIAALHRLTVKT